MPLTQSTSQIETAQAIESLLQYAISNLDFKQENLNCARNMIFNRLKISCSVQNATNIESVNSILNKLANYAVNSGICPPDEKENLKAELIGYLIPQPYEIIKNFDEIFTDKGPNFAMEYFYNIAVKGNYINKDKISKTVTHCFNGTYSPLYLSVNSMKKESSFNEKTYKDKMPSSEKPFPLCPLCSENEGAYNGAKSNLRLLPIELGGRFWNIQFSPFPYFKKHIIVSYSQHIPMKNDIKKFEAMIDFSTVFEDYFIASNTELENIGGSLLCHEHMQGGLKNLPIFNAEEKERFYSKKYENINLSLLDWYLPVFKITSDDKIQLLSAIEDIVNAFINYNDESINLICKTEKNQHSSVNTVCYNENGKTVFLIIPRNNRTSEQCPKGIFCPDESCKEIKKEGIGIIEIMGYFILPSRLACDSKYLVDFLTGKSKTDLKEKNSVYSEYSSMLSQLINDYGINITESKAKEIINDYINNKCETMLEQSAVFKNNEEGKKALAKFLESINMIKIK